MDAGWRWRAVRGWKALLARLLAPFARRNPEPLLEDAAEMGEVVKAPREGDLPDVPGMVRRVGEVALAALQPLRLSLNPLSRFDFGALAGLTFARKWQAKQPRRRATV